MFHNGVNKCVLCASGVRFKNMDVSLRIAQVLQDVSFHNAPFQSAPATAQRRHVDTELLVSQPAV